MAIMKMILTVFSIFGACLIQAQTIEKFSIDSGGDNFNDGTVQVLYTIGEVNVQELIAGNLIVSEGFIISGNAGPLSIYEPIVNKIVVFPNPTSRFINISSDILITKIEIYDLLGKQILTTGFQNQIDVSSYQAGIYLIKLYFEKQYSIKRFVIK
jgi:hypothetical protein